MRTNGPIPWKIIVRGRQRRSFGCWKKYIGLSTLVGAVFFILRGILGQQDSDLHEQNYEKVAIVFYGSPRSLQWTISSIEQQIIGPLQRHGIYFELFLHSYIHQEGYSNKRSNESETRLNNSEWKLLKPTQFKLEYLNEVQKKYEALFERLKVYGDSWKDDFESLHRYLLGSH